MSEFKGLVISGSIISKKGAESLSALVLDVKFGQAALYKDLKGAKELAHLLVCTLRKVLSCKVKQFESTRQDKFGLAPLNAVNINQLTSDTTGVTFCHLSIHGNQ